MSETVQIAFVGDVYLGQPPFVRLEPEVADVFSRADLVVINQEGPITDAAESVVGKCLLRSHPGAAAELRRWGIAVATVANNHMFDYGRPGFEQTRRLLNEAGIRTLGAGRNLNEATQPLLLEIKGLKLGLLAYSWAFVQTTCATPDAFGCAPLEEELMLKQVGELRNETDAVIVLPHWGYCDNVLPTPQQVELAARLKAAGATAVIGSHAHVVQGIDHRDGKLAAYSLGDFAFAPFTDRGRPSMFSRDNLAGMILVVTFSPGGVVSHEVIHTLRDDRSVRLDRDPSRAEELAKRSRPLIGGEFAACWRSAMRRRMLRRALFWLNVFNWRHVRKETLIGGWLMLKGMLGLK